jgi:hypothetical protein
MPATLFDKARTAARLLGEVAAELDGGVLDVEGAKRLVDVFTRCERFAVASRQIAARRVATAVNWKHAGHRNPAEWLASATGVGVGEAGRELETAKRLEELPDTAAAVRAGELSGAQASEIAASASVDPHAEAHLLTPRAPARPTVNCGTDAARSQPARATTKRTLAGSTTRAPHAPTEARPATSSCTPSSRPTSAPACTRSSNRRPTSSSAPPAAPAPPKCAPRTAPTRSLR